MCNFYSLFKIKKNNNLKVDGSDFERPHVEFFNPGFNLSYFSYQTMREVYFIKSS